jgi:hypothetical protein
MINHRRKLILILGIFVGLWDIFIGLSSPNSYSIIIGLMSIFLSLGFFMLWRWIIIPIFIFCTCIFLLYILLFITALPGAFQPAFAAIAMVLFSPQLILCLLLIDKLSRKEVRSQFK